MHIDPYIIIAGLIVGFTVGLTGMGGGALMTPILVLIFHVEPLTAVSSDLVAALFMKPVGASVHIKRKTVDWGLVKWLCIGSVPAAFSGVYVLRAIGGGNPEALADRLKIILGVTLLIAVVAMVVRTLLQNRQAERLREQGIDPHADDHKPVKVRKGLTIAIGAIGGLIVGMTSVGSGSLIIISLLMIYPTLRGPRLVGTDLVQAIPLVAAAAVAHIAAGDFVLGLTASILIGSMPGVYIGARMSSKAPDAIIRPVLAFVLLLSGLKLVNVSTGWLAVIMGTALIVGFPLWGAADAAIRPEAQWSAAGLQKKLWVRLQGIGAFFGVGFVAAIKYFATERPKLEAAAVAEEHPLLVGDPAA